MRFQNYFKKPLNQKYNSNGTVACSTIGTNCGTFYQAGKHWKPETKTLITRLLRFTPNKCHSPSELSFTTKLGVTLYEPCQVSYSGPKPNYYHMYMVYISTQPHRTHKVARG